MAVLELYAPEKGRYARWVVGLSAILMLSYGVHSLFFALPESARQPLLGWRPLGDAFPISLSFVVALGVLAVGGFGIWWLINFKRFVNFLHDVELELTKVNWPSRTEVISSSTIVVITTVILAVWVGLADVMLEVMRNVFGKLFGG